jgi:hypothetical protein
VMSAGVWYQPQAVPAQRRTQNAEGEKLIDDLRAMLAFDRQIGCGKPCGEASGC